MIANQANIRKINLLPVFNTAAALLAALLFLSSCTSDATSIAPPEHAKPSLKNVRMEAPAIPVNAVAVQRTEWPRRISLDAEIISLASPDISSQVSGNVAEVYVVPGQAVKKGQKLVALDSHDLFLAAAEAQANAAHFASQLADKKRLLARNAELLEKGFISQAALQTIQAEVASVEQQLHAAQAREELARSNLAKAQIAAPYDATVSTLNVASGAYVRSGDRLLSLWSTKASSLRLRIPQQYAGKVTAGWPLTLQWRGKDIETRLLHVRPDIDAPSRSFEAHAKVPPELHTMTGAALTATMTIDHEALLSVPAAAIQLNGNEAFVYIVDAQNKALKQPVKLGRQLDGHVEITHGIKEGAAVIVEGSAFLRAGQAVTVRGGGRQEPEMQDPLRKLVSINKGALAP